MAYKTENNIQEAFGGESKANRRYLFYADRAEKEGYTQVARLFRAVAEAETVHAHNHLDAIDSISYKRTLICIPFPNCIAKLLVFHAYCI